MIRLLFSSGLVSTLYVAGVVPWLSIAFSRAVEAEAFAACVCFVWAMYLVDRLGSHPEDEGGDSASAAADVKKHRPLWIGLLAALIVAELWLIARTPRFGLSVLVSLLVSIGYVLPLPLLGRRVKEIPYMKALFLPMSMVVIPATFVDPAAWPAPERAAPVVAVVWLVLFVNSTLYDLKDVTRDRAAGIKTLAGALRPARFLALEALVLVVAAALSTTLLHGPSRVVSFAAIAVYAPTLLVLSRRRFDDVMSSAIDGLHGALMLVAWAVFAGGA